MPFPQHNWEAVVGNRLFAEQLSYDNDEQTGLAYQRIPTLNSGQRAAFDAIVNAVESKSGQTFFLHVLEELEKPMFTTCTVKEKL